MAKKLGLQKLEYISSEPELVPEDEMIFRMVEGVKSYDIRSSKPLAYACVVGHYIVGPVTPVGATFGGFKKPNTTRPVFACISRCGAGTLLGKDDIERGCPPTCARCDPSMIQTGGFLSEANTKLIQVFWENVVPQAYEPEVKNNINAGPARRAWDEGARPFVIEILKSMDVGIHFGWKLFVRTTNYTPQQKDVPMARIAGISPETRKFTIDVRAPGSQNAFVVDVATPRTDVTIAALAKQFEAAAAEFCNPGRKYMLPPPAQSGPVETAVVAAAATPAPTDIVDLGKLNEVTAKLARIGAIGRDLNELAALKAKAEARVAAAATADAQARERFRNADEEYSVASNHRAVMKDRYDDAARRAQNAKVDYETAAERERERKAALDAAIAAADPVNEELADARRELEECERLAAETMKSVGDADKLTALLKALAGL